VTDQTIFVPNDPNDPFALPIVVRAGDVVMGLPLQSAGRLPCQRCDVGHTLTGSQVLDAWEGEKPVCRECALLDPRLAPWQALADAGQAMDRAFIAAGTREHRQWFADHLADAVGAMASWRSPEDEPITPRAHS